MVNKKYYSSCCCIRLGKRYHHSHSLGRIFDLIFVDDRRCVYGNDLPRYFERRHFCFCMPPKVHFGESWLQNSFRGLVRHTLHSTRKVCMVCVPAYLPPRVRMTNCFRTSLLPVFCLLSRDPVQFWYLPFGMAGFVRFARRHCMVAGAAVRVGVALPFFARVMDAARSWPLFGPVPAFVCVLFGGSGVSSTQPHHHTTPTCQVQHSSGVNMNKHTAGRVETASAAVGSATPVIGRDPGAFAVGVPPCTEPTTPLIRVRTGLFQSSHYSSSGHGFEVPYLPFSLIDGRVGAF